MPGYRSGGPVVSIANLVAFLGDSINFKIVTSDRDAGDTSPYQGIMCKRWLPCGKADVFYLEPSSVTVKELVRIINLAHPEIIYLNSFFDRRFTAKILFARRFWSLPDCRVILAPRGEFSLGALSLKSMRKSVYIATLKSLGFLTDVEWHASTEVEAKEIENALKISANSKVRVHVASDLGKIPDRSIFNIWQPRGEGEPLRICFFARVSPMKNLLLAIKAVGAMKSKAQLTVYGPIEDFDYWRECELESKKLPSHVRFSYLGELRPNEVHAALAAQDVFFLPTLGENYGHVILEALSVGLPAVISNRTPWRNLSARGIGHDGPLDATDFALNLDKLASLSPENLRHVREACQQYAIETLTDPNTIERNRQLFFTL